MQALSSLYQPIADHLAAVRRIIEDELASDAPFVNALCAHVERFRGKMLRPALVLLSGDAAGRLTREHDVLAAVVELVHLATLVHDDVLDEASVRRGVSTINALQGNEGAVLLGDYLISHAFHLCSSLDSQYASRQIGSTTNTVCEGELLQVHQRHNLRLTEQEYFDIITRKTASLTSTCCLLGAKFAGAESEVICALETFGLSLGISFQIVDDILDIVGTEQEMGKTLGSDLQKRKLTLPVIHLLHQGARTDREEALLVLSNGYAGQNGRIRELLVRNESLTYAFETARKYVMGALSALEALRPSQSLDSLRSMAEFVLKRRG